MDRDNNRIVLSGVLEDAPVPDHQVMGEMFYTCVLKVTDCRACRTICR